MRFLSLLLTAFILLSLTGCESGENIKNGFNTVIDEIVEAYTNVTTKVTDTKEWVDEKVDQTEQAVEDVQEATNSINEAVNSVKALTGGDEDDVQESPIE